MRPRRPARGWFQSHSKSQSDQDRPGREDVQEQAFAVVDRHPRAEQRQESHDRSNQEQRERVGAAVLPALHDPQGAQGLQAGRHRRREVKPRVVPGHIAIGEPRGRNTRP